MNGLMEKSELFADFIQNIDLDSKIRHHRYLYFISPINEDGADSNPRDSEKGVKRN